MSPLFPLEAWGVGLIAEGLQVASMNCLLAAIQPAWTMDMNEMKLYQ